MHATSPKLVQNASADLQGTQDDKPNRHRGSPAVLTNRQSLIVTNVISMHLELAIWPPNTNAETGNTKTHLIPKDHVSTKLPIAPPWGSYLYNIYHIWHISYGT